MRTRGTPKVLADSTVSLSFPVIRLESEAGERIKVTPDDVQDVFTYPLTEDLRPNEAEWETAIHRAMDLALREKIPLQIDDR